MLKRIDNNMLIVDRRNDNRYSACVDDLLDVGIAYGGVDALVVPSETNQRSELSLRKRLVYRIEMRLKMISAQSLLLFRVDFLHVRLHANGNFLRCSGLSLCLFRNDVEELNGEDKR